MKKIYLLILLALICIKSNAQQELNAFTVTGSGQATMFSTDYQCIGINPSNLGWESKRKIHLGFLETGASLYSDALNKIQLQNSFLTFGNFGGSDLNSKEKKDAALNFAQKGLAINLEEQWLGASFQYSKIGGIGVSVRERVSLDAKLNSTFADILFNGRNASYFDSSKVSNGDTTGLSRHPSLLSAVTDGSFIKMSWYREYNLSYGRKLFSNDLIKIYGGATLKYLQGYGILDIESKNGVLTAYSSLSPVFNIKYNTISPSLDTSGKFKPVGQGFGFDLGGSMDIGNFITVGLSMNNIGAMTWRGNVFEVNDTALASLKTGGLNKLNFLSETGSFLSDKGFFKWKGLASKTIPLPTDIRMGVKVKLLSIIKVGLDVYIPTATVPGNFRNALFALGGELKLGIFKFSTGVATGTNYQLNVPVGFVFSLGGRYEYGVASRDVITFFTNNNPNLSAVFGFLRFGI